MIGLTLMMLALQIGDEDNDYPGGTRLPPTQMITTWKLPPGFPAHEYSHECECGICKHVRIIMVNCRVWKITGKKSLFGIDDLAPDDVYFFTSPVGAAKSAIKGNVGEVLGYWLIKAKWKKRSPFIELDPHLCGTVLFEYYAEYSCEGSIESMTAARTDTKETEESEGDVESLGPGGVVKGSERSGGTTWKSTQAVGGSATVGFEWTQYSWGPVNMGQAGEARLVPCQCGKSKAGKRRLSVASAPKGDLTKLVGSIEETFGMTDVVVPVKDKAARAAIAMSDFDVAGAVTVVAEDAVLKQAASPIQQESGAVVVDPARVPELVVVHSTPAAEAGKPADNRWYRVRFVPSVGAESAEKTGGVWIRTADDPGTGPLALSPHRAPSGEFRTRLVGIDAEANAADAPVELRKGEDALARFHETFRVRADDGSVSRFGRFDIPNSEALGALKAADPEALIVRVGRPDGSFSDVPLRKVAPKVVRLGADAPEILTPASEEVGKDIKVTFVSHAWEAALNNEYPPGTVEMVGWVVDPDGTKTELVRTKEDGPHVRTVSRAKAGEYKFGGTYAPVAGAARQWFSTATGVHDRLVERTPEAGPLIPDPASLRREP